jgi:hypothetical protein
VRAEALSRKFAAALRCDPATSDSVESTGVLLGIEHEFFVVHDGARVDFGPLLAGLNLGRRYLDPADVNARRLPTGAAVTCDGVEAEIALPPINVAPGFVVEATRRAAAERSDLRHHLGDGFALEGSSTHISVSINCGIEVIDATARLYSCTFAPALMLLLDRRDSYGIYVRPRPGRIEVCGEYATGRRLQAAIAFAVGSVRACVNAVVGRRQQVPLPPRLWVDLKPSPDRFGYVVHHNALGTDLYARGRDAPLALAGGGSISADAVLRACWSSARDALGPLGSGADAQAANDLVDSDCALPARGLDADDDAPVPVCSSPVYGRLVEPVQRPRFEMAAVMVTWDAAVLVVAQVRERRAAFVCVPRAAMDRFFERLDSGALDGIITRYLRHRHRPRHRLERHEQITKPGLYGSLSRRRSLLAREPDARLQLTSALT